MSKLLWIDRARFENGSIENGKLILTSPDGRTIERECPDPPDEKTKDPPESKTQT